MVKPMTIYDQFIDPSKLLMVCPTIGYHLMLKSPDSFSVEHWFGPTFLSPAVALTLSGWGGARVCTIDIKIYKDINRNRRVFKKYVIAEYVADIKEYRALAKVLDLFGEDIAGEALEEMTQHRLLNMFHLASNAVHRKMNYRTPKWRLSQVHLPPCNFPHAGVEVGDPRLNDPHIAIRGRNTLTGMCRTSRGKDIALALENSHHQSYNQSA